MVFQGPSDFWRRNNFGIFMVFYGRFVSPKESGGGGSKGPSSEQNMKILLLTYNFPPIEGGISTHSFEVAKNRSMQGVEVIVVAPGGKKTSVVDS